jgi:hypothetical protein
LIPVKYRQACIARVKPVWSSIRNAMPVVTWHSRRKSSVAQAGQDTAAPGAAASPASTVAEDTLAQAVAHIEYLGYETGPADPNGWRYAIHPHRYNFHLSTAALGIRLHCTLPIGAAIGNSRVGWLEFLNTANERGLIAQFSLFEDKAGVHRVRMFAFVSGPYNRAVFAMAMDMWHDDLDLIRHKPEFLLEGGADEDEEDDDEVIVNRTCH